METGIEKIDSRQPYNYRYIQKLRSVRSSLLNLMLSNQCRFTLRDKERSRLQSIMIHVFVDKAAGRKPEDAVEAIRESV